MKFINLNFLRRKRRVDRSMTVYDLATTLPTRYPLTNFNKDMLELIKHGFVVKDNDTMKYSLTPEGLERMTNLNENGEKNENGL